MRGGPAWDRLLQRYDRHYERANSWIDPRDDLEHVREYDRQFGWLVSALAPGSRVLDIGCGTGKLLSWLCRYPSVVPVGVDASPGQVRLARSFLPAEVQIYLADATEYCRAHAGEYAGVFCMDVIEHIPDVDLFGFLEAARGALVPGGWFVCRTPNMANLTGTYSRYMDLTHVRGFTRTSLLQTIEAAGFTDCAVLRRAPCDPAQGVRMALESLLHRLVFRACGKGKEYYFSANVLAIGFRGEPDRA